MGSKKAKTIIHISLVSAPHFVYILDRINKIYRNDLKSCIFDLTAHKICIYKKSMTLTAILTEDSDGSEGSGINS